MSTQPVAQQAPAPPPVSVQPEPGGHAACPLLLPPLAFEQTIPLLLPLPLDDVALEPPPSGLVLPEQPLSATSDAVTANEAKERSRRALIIR